MLLVMSAFVWENGGQDYVMVSLLNGWRNQEYIPTWELLVRKPEITIILPNVLGIQMDPSRGYHGHILSIPVLQSNASFGGHCISLNSPHFSSSIYSNDILMNKNTKRFFQMCGHSRNSFIVPYRNLRIKHQKNVYFPNIMKNNFKKLILRIIYSKEHNYPTFTATFTWAFILKVICQKQTCGFLVDRVRHKVVSILSYLHISSTRGLMLAIHDIGSRLVYYTLRV